MSLRGIGKGVALAKPCEGEFHLGSVLVGFKDRNWLVTSAKCESAVKQPAVSFFFDKDKKRNDSEAGDG